jgi:phage baseplate assembly protein W
MNIDFPYHIDSRGRTAVTDDDEHLCDMLEQLIFTGAGERVNRPDFGSGILQLIFAPNSPELASALQFTLQAAIQRWLGDIVELQALDVRSVDSTLTIDVKYRVRRNDQMRTASFVRTI